MICTSRAPLMWWSQANQLRVIPHPCCGWKHWMYGETNPRITGKLDVKTGISVPFCPWEKVSRLRQCLFPSTSRRPGFCYRGCVSGIEYIKEKIFPEGVTAFSCVSFRFKTEPKWHCTCDAVCSWSAAPLDSGCATMDGPCFWGPTAWLQSGVMGVQSIQTVIGVMSNAL